MIWHAVEVWGLVLVAFVAGCVLGTLLHMALAASPFAPAQVATADAIGVAFGNMRSRIGINSGAAHRYARAAPIGRFGAAPESASAGEIRRAEWPHATDPIDEAAAAIDVALETPAAEWEEDAYWDDGMEDSAPVPAAAGQPAPSPRPLPAPMPDPALPPDLPAMRPLTLPGPRNGVPDNLQRIRGIGQKNEELLNSLGIYHFGQIAAWTPAEARWVANHLAFPERIERDDWIGQAIILATGGNTGYVKAVDRRRSEDEPPAVVAEP